MLIEYTKNYIDAFSDRNIKKVAMLLADEFLLEDPIVKRVEGKKRL